MRVALVNYTYGGASGSGRHVRLLHRGLIEEGVDAFAVHRGNSWELGIPKLRSLTFSMGASLRVRGLDLVHIHSPKLLPTLALAEVGVVTVHGGEFEFRKKYGAITDVLWFGMRAMRRRIGAITTVMKYEAERRGWAWVPNMTDIDAIEEIKPSRENLVLFVGRNDPIKNYRLFKEVVNALKLRHVAFGVERIAPWGEVISHMKSAVCLMMTSIWEGMPSVVLEAWASGCPVIANRIPAFEPFSDALLLTRPARDDWVAAFHELENARDRLVRRGKAIVKDFDYKKVTKRYLQLYDALT
ncbi:MAG: glycosyltransferase family 4 protein [Thaumarchaeota archaeon]|nr:glycosyltransferase family 4 protein [Candidatus Calditenuaceae archaeon]MDW8041654.1 glycosyltransferase family 4 protein [Nitrososphaerota archaeon]